MEPMTTRVFINGNGQAVRIPAQLRLDTERLEISRTADGDLLLHPIPTSRGQALLDLLAGFDDDFVASVEQGRWPIPAGVASASTTPSSSRG